MGEPDRKAAGREGSEDSERQEEPELLRSTELHIRSPSVERRSHSGYLSGEGNVSFTKDREGERGVCVCTVTHNGKSRPFSCFTR